jgi:YD repeat-containing protein
MAWFTGAALALIGPYSQGASYSSYDALPPGSFPAGFYWGPIGGRCVMVTEEFRQSYPGYRKVTAYSQDLDYSSALVSQNYADIIPAIAAAENYTKSYWNGLDKYYKINSFERTFSMAYRAGAQLYPSWILHGTYTDTGTPYTDNYCKWSMPYNGRVCPVGYTAGMIDTGTPAQPNIIDVACVPFDVKEPGCPKPQDNNGSNPICGKTGNKYQSIPVFSGLPDGRLRFSFYYNSRQGRGLLTHTYDRSIETSFGLYEDDTTRQIIINDIARYATPDYPVPPMVVTLKRPDGKEVRHFAHFDAETLRTDQARWMGGERTGAQLTSIQDGQGNPLSGLLYTDTRGEKESYDRGGRLLQLTTRTGMQEQLQYDTSGRLIGVTDSFGNSLQFTYDDPSHDEITALITPDGKTYRFSYTGEGMLASITYPDTTPENELDNPSRTFHYENTAHPTLLTGITNEAGVRAATWTYDSQARGTGSEHAGGADRYTLSYDSASATTVTDPLNQQRTYTLSRVGGFKQITAISGGYCEACGGHGKQFEYDERGFLVKEIDHNDHATTYVRDERGREIARTEAQGTPQARTVSTQWHAEFNKPARITYPDHIVEYTYDSAGRLLGKTERAAP